MPNESQVRPPLSCRLLIRLASRIVPGSERRPWLAKRRAELESWCVLAERGEFARNVHRQMAGECLGAFADALWIRCSREQIAAFARGPAFPLLVSTAVLLLAAAFTHGLAYTRALADSVADPGAHALVALGSSKEMLAAHAFPIAFALIVGVALVTIGHRSFGRHGWRYWAFLVVKTIAVATIVPILWIESGAAIRAHLSLAPVWMGLAGLAFTALYITLFGCALLWSFRDQRRRCPVCLHRLTLPVSVGSWASMLEPPATELMCIKGHGALSAPESDNGESDRWVKLDSSWQELFETQVR